MFGPHVPSCGPANAKIAVLAEAPGTEESERGEPLVGPSGQELRRMMRVVGLELEECWRGNVFSRQPEANNVALYGDVRTGDTSERFHSKGPLSLNPLTYLARTHEADVERCLLEISRLDANVIIALGNTACWVLGLGQGIGQLRGTLHLWEGRKVIPTYHPAAVLREYSLRVVAIADLEKARAESHTPHATFDNTTLWLNPTLDDLRGFDVDHMQKSRVCAVDIETKRGQITCLSFAPSVDQSLVIPFWIEGVDASYWSATEEVLAWRWVRKWMEREDLTKVFQNGLYDLSYLIRYCTPRSCTEDTMLMHHSLYSELPKGLGFLGSLYANVPAWKKMRTFKKEEQLKRDD